MQSSVDRHNSSKQHVETFVNHTKKYENENVIFFMNFINKNNCVVLKY